MSEKLRQAAKQALVALDELYYSNGTELAEHLYEVTSEALREALAEPAEREPTSDWISYDKHSDVVTIRGRRYAAALFDERGFGAPPGTLLRIVDGPADVVTLERLAEQPAEQPVAWIDEFGNVFPLGAQRGPKYLRERMKPLYTAPQPANRDQIHHAFLQGLRYAANKYDAAGGARFTGRDVSIFLEMESVELEAVDIDRAIEAAHGITKE